ncbi:MAG: alkaline phosphatase D family protein [Opitutaceae bacterium]
MCHDEPASIFTPSAHVPRLGRRLSGLVVLAGVLLGTAGVAWGGIEFGPLCGAVTSNSAEIRVSVSPGVEPWSLVARPTGRGGEVVSASGMPVSEGSAMRSFRLGGLDPETEYDYAVVEGSGSMGVAATGRFRTFPARAASFRFAFSSCARTGSDHEVFSAIRAADPLFFMNIGDLHYEDIARNDPAAFRAAYKRVFTAGRQAALLRAAPFVYVWDDHDFGPGNSDRSSPSREAARLAYREVVPHYPLAFGDGDEAVAQAFSVGRARFLVTDLRSERSPSGDADNKRKTMLGDLQKEWLKREVLATHKTHAVIFWVSSVGWIARARRGSDDWGAYDTERRELARFFAENEVRNLIILSGNAHMLAADDGSNTRIVDGDGSAAAPLAVFQAAPLDQAASYKGGPYSHGAYLPGAAEGCFGLVEVEDDGSRVKVVFSGRNHLQEEKIRLAIDVPAEEVAKGE